LKRFDFFVIPFLMDVAVAMSQLMCNFRALDLGASASLVGTMMGVCWCVPYVAASSLTGRTLARVGARTAMIGGSVLFAVGTALCAAAGSPWLLLAASPLSGAGSGLFWPAFQTCLKSPDSDETRARAGIFNVSWTFGILTGGASAGHLYHIIGPRGALLAVAGLILFVTMLIWLRAVPPQDEPLDGASGTEKGTEASDARAAAFRHIAWIANFALWFAGAAAGSVFPRLARGLGYGDGAIGEILAVVWIGQVALFGILSGGAWWHYRKGPLLVGLVGCLGAMALFGWGASAVVFVAAFLVLGASRGPTHAGSVHYSLTSGNRDANMGYHEAVLGAGGVFGAVLGGLAADIAGIRAPFALAAAVAVAALAVAAAWPVRSVEPVRLAPAAEPAD
jgi:predicted MFS family arabinose efflux permease